MGEDNDVGNVEDCKDHIKKSIEKLDKDHDQTADQAHEGGTLENDDDFKRMD